MKRRRMWILVSAAAIAALALVVAIDDPVRDFTTNHANISETAKDPELRPREYEMAVPVLAEAVERAARRISNWEYIGTAGVEGATLVVFERTSRVWKLKDDVIIRIEKRGGRSRLTGESSSRTSFGDLGQNPRNLRRILAELDVVLAADARPTNAAAANATR